MTTAGQAWARRVIGAVLALSAVGAGTAACSSAPGGSGRGTTTATPGPPGLAVPLDATTATSADEVVVVAMGDLQQPVNTFWQLFVRPTGAEAWSLDTPPGVADNGGLVATASTTPSGAFSSMLVGFEASQDLHFSPLATSTDLGRSWSPGLVTSALAATPDALALDPSVAGRPDAVSPATGGLALVRGEGGRVLAEGGDASSWSTLVDEEELASSPAGGACRPAALTAVALDPTGQPLVGAACDAPGVVGIFGDTASGWRPVGPAWSGPATTVLRLVDLGTVVQALVAQHVGAVVSVVGLELTAAGTWERSAPLSLSSGAQLVSTGIRAGGGFVVVTSTGRRLAAQVESGPAGAWQPLPAPPPGTLAIVAGTGGAVDALTVASTRFSDWALNAGSGTWVARGSVFVPIEFGSSS